MFIDVFLWLGLPAALIAAYFVLKDEFEENATSYREWWASWKEARER